MKKSIKISAITLAILSIFTVSTRAQEGTPSGDPVKSGFRLSVGPEVALPIGDFSDRYNWAIGGSVQGELPILKDQLFVTLNAAYLSFIKNDDYTGTYQSNLQLIPVKAGLKYFPVKNFFVQGEAGVSFLTNKDDVGATKSATFAYAPQIGYQFNLGNSSALDLGVRFQGNSKFTDNGSSNNFFGLRVAYSFGL